MMMISSLLAVQWWTYKTDDQLLNECFLQEKMIMTLVVVVLSVIALCVCLVSLKKNSKTTTERMKSLLEEKWGRLASVCVVVEGLSRQAWKGRLWENWQRGVCQFLLFSVFLRVKNWGRKTAVRTSTSASAVVYYYYWCVVKKTSPVMLLQQPKAKPKQNEVTHSQFVSEKYISCLRYIRSGTTFCPQIIPFSRVFSLSP